MNLDRGRRGVFVIALAASVFVPAVSWSEDARWNTPVVAGSELDYPPYALAEDGQADGFSVDLMKAVCETMGIAVTFRVGPWDEVRGALERGEIDVLPLVSYSVERNKAFDFTMPYTVAHGAVFKRESAAEIGSVVDLRDKVISVMRADAAHDWLIRNDLSKNLVLTRTVEESLRLVASGKVDYALAPRLVGLLTIRRQGLSNIETTGPLIDAYGRGYGFAVQKGNTALQALLNEGLGIVRQTGRYDEIYQKWFGDVDPPGIPRAAVFHYALWGLLGILILGGVAFVWIVVLRGAVQARTRELRDARDSLEVLVAERTGQLRDKNFILDAVIDGAKETIFVKDHDGRFLLFNQRGKDRFGLDPESLLGKTAYDLFPPEVAATMVAHDRAVMETGIASETEETLVLMWEERRIHTYKTPYRDAQGDIIGVIGISHDVTERRNAERELETSQKRWQYALEGAGDGVWDWDCRTNEVTFSRQWKAMLGFEDHEVGSTLDEWRKRVHPDDVAECEEDLKKHSLGLTETYVNEHRMLCKDGSYKWILDRGKVIERTAEGQPVRMIGTHTDITERKLAEAALDRREQYLRTILQTTVDGFWVLDAEGGFIDCNEAYCRMSGYNRDEALRLRIADVDVVDDPEAIWARIRRIIATGAETFETRHRRRDGSTLEVEVSATYLATDGGRFICFCRDITARKLAEERIRDDARRMRSIANVLQYGGTTVQEYLDHALGEAIKLAESRFGYIYFYDEVKKEFVLNTWSKDVMKECLVANPQTRYALDKTGVWGEAVRQRRPIIMNDFQAAHPLKKGYPEGHVPLVRFMTVPVFKGDQIVAVVGVANKVAEYDERDVLQLTLLMDAVWKSVDSKKAQDALRESEERFAKAFRASPAPMSVTDIDSGVTFDVNDEWLSMLGYSRNDVIGKTSAELGYWGATGREAIIDLLRREGSFRGFEAIVLSRQGKERKVILAGERIDDHRILLVFHDISEQLEMQRRLAHSQKMEAVGQLTGGIAHDFNNLLQIAVANVDLVEHLAAAGNDEVQNCLSRAKSALIRGGALTQQLLSFARRQMLEPTLVDPNSLVDATAQLLVNTLGEKVRTEVVLAPDVPKILVDPNGLENVLVNIALNSRAAMPRGGDLTFMTRRTVLNERIAVDDDELLPGDYLEILVTDTGCGMTKEVIQHAFEPFFTTKEVGEGSGLGLSMVYGFTRQSGGLVTLKSEVGQGTTVSILLPSADFSRETAADKVEPQERLGPGTVLVVEDDPDVRETISLMVRHIGYWVWEAEGAGSALALLESHPNIDLLLSDVMMRNGVNGIELGREAKRRHPGLKVLLTSGYSEDVIQTSGLQESGFSLLRKPYARETLARALAREISPGAPPMPCQYSEAGYGTRSRL